MTYKPFDLTGKVALVTGGNGGIGLGMAEALAQAGATVAIWGTNESKNQKALEAIKSHGGEAKAWKVNVADETEVADAMNEVVAMLGRVDTVIANAGVSGGDGPIGQHSTEAYRKIMSVNVDGVFFTLRAAANHMAERAKKGDPGGSLVAVASMAALEGAARNSAYGASKAAVCSMIRAVAVEYARYGVTANAILPGWIATDMTGKAQDNQKFVDNVISRVPMRRWGEPEDFGGVAVYLASSASRFHTGDSFLIDGGYCVF